MFTLRIRSNPGSEIIADYECPEHGRFTVTVARTETGDPPATLPCNFFDDEDCMCCARSPWRPSAPGAVHVKAGEMVRGKGGERPADRYVMNTEKLADGMPLDQWKAERAAVHRDESLRRVRSALGRGRKVWG